MTRTRSLLATTALAALLATGCEYVEVDGVGTRTYDAEFVPQADITDFTGCSRNQANQWEVGGSVTNHTPDRATYAVTIAFMEDTTRLDERTLWIRDLAPGQTGAMNRGWWINNPDSVTSCEVLTIDRVTTAIVDPAEATTAPPAA
ncbi:MAG: hypothetical protein ACR2P0_09220 [Acidimicrobiales bacterium]